MPRGMLLPSAVDIMKDNLLKPLQDVIPLTLLRAKQVDVYKISMDAMQDADLGMVLYPG